MIYPGVYLTLAMIGLISSRRTDLIWLALTLSFLLLFMGTRYYVGCDFHGYLVRFENTDPGTPILPAFQLNEPLFQVLTLGVVNLGLDYMWLNVFASLIIVAGWGFFLKSQSNPTLILALIFPILIVQLSMSGLRQAIALSLFMVSVVFWLRGQRVASALWILLGAQFHTSLYIFLPMSALAGRKVSTVRLCVAVILLTPVAGFLLQDRLNVYVDRYINQINGELISGGAFVRYAINLLPVPFFFQVRRSIASRKPETYELLKLFAIIIVILAPIGLWSSVALHRLNYYVMPFSILIFIATVDVLFKSRQRQLAYLLPLLVYGGYMAFWLSMSRHARECYLPYDTYLF